MDNEALTLKQTIEIRIRERERAKIVLKNKSSLFLKIRNKIDDFLEKKDRETKEKIKELEERIKELEEIKEKI